MLSSSEHFPALERVFPRIRLASFPTPVMRLNGLERELGAGPLFFKDDGACGKRYGGNKVRKLEFLLAEALEKKSREIVTVGYAGSNHATATAIYGRALDLGVTSMLLAQPNAQYVRQNLLVGHACGAELRHCDTVFSLTASVATAMVQKRLRTRRPVHFIPPGGSSLRGCLGYVNAAFELADQIRAGVLPPPARIYVALGTMGTAAGLAAGLATAGIDTHVIGVRVVDERIASQRKLEGKIEALGQLLQRADPSIFVGSVPVRVLDDYFGSQYGRFTERGMAAVRRAEQSDGIVLEGTYTGKTMAALIDGAGKPDRRPVLFWNTYNTRDLSALVDEVDYRELPRQFHRYFTHPAQALDWDH